MFFIRRCHSYILRLQHSFIVLFNGFLISLNGCDIIYIAAPKSSDILVYLAASYSLILNKAMISEGTFPLEMFIS